LCVEFGNGEVYIFVTVVIVPAMVIVVVEGGGFTVLPSPVATFSISSRSPLPSLPCPFPLSMMNLFNGGSARPEGGALFLVILLKAPAAPLRWWRIEIGLP
jgi:hypothetical protein